uniref:Uncharacterized protein n=1 Tax=Panagrolaimus davidi TaxID=227884 RepID=A0A914PWB3_9BILA
MLSSSSSESEKEYPEINELENVEQSLTPGEDERGIGNALDQVVMDLREEGVDELRDEGIHEEVPLCSGEGFPKNEFIVSKSKEELQQWPDFIQDRIQLFDKLMAKHKEELASKTIQPITISLGNGKDIKGQSWKTTPLQIIYS